MTLVLAVLALLVALVSLLVALLVRRTTRRPAGEPDAPADLLGLRHEVAALKRDMGLGFRHLAVVRYDAFADSGGHLSWSVALLDDTGSGIVLTSIHGRMDTRTYAKPITDWASDQQLSPEEEQAIANARP